MKTHRYLATLRWTGNRGAGTRGYTGYDRSWRAEIDGRPALEGSADPMFRGDATRHNPEDLLLAAISSCHMLWYLHLCADAGVIVESYTDAAEAEMQLEPGGAGQFVAATLRPAVMISPESDADAASRLHERAHEMCFIARSLNFPVTCEPHIAVNG